jgi:hypothetical protein
MTAQHVKAYRLLATKPGASCCDCGKEVGDAPEEQIWTIWNRKMIYCPKCAKNEGIGPDS